MKDIMGLMKQAQGLQQKMADMQAELETLEVEGTSGGGVVKVVATAKGQVKNVSIDPSLMLPDEKEVLEDLLVAALNDARGRGERLMQERMADLTRGLPLPPGLKLF
ncbi:YbaB/EbfC family nucleoid-associated protein [Enterovirga aerilata]|uniref:Nucleoid-associated protein HJG44_16375 n=1 Tax=Enterovirga aerilata TaxID=2730920 RepID=A0A849IC11_9HYPH|nr:YbaB/EbfC family nucleoid-associated protein [Enterovirga sp. DB1703]NNM73959.1 YbaB/EbfC family nucleoid-associated protein [Enterovirga sp. DB1703]